MEQIRLDLLDTKLKVKILEAIFLDLFVNHWMTTYQELYSLLRKEADIFTEVIKYLEDLKWTFKLFLFLIMLVIWMIQKIFTDNLEFFIYKLLDQLIDSWNRDFIKCFTFSSFSFLRKLHHAIFSALMNTISLILDSKVDCQGIPFTTLKHLQYAIYCGGELLLLGFLLVFLCLRLYLSHDLI